MPVLDATQDIEKSSRGAGSNPATGAPSPFLSGTKIQYAWDSTSLGWFKTCPRLYQYHMIEGWRGKGGSVHLEFGSLYHSALEAYDKLRVDHLDRRAVDHEDALILVVQQILIATWVTDHYKCINGHDKCNEMSPDRSCPYCEPVGAPLDWGHNLKTRETLIRSIIWYLDEFKRPSSENGDSG